MTTPVKEPCEKIEITRAYVLGTLEVSRFAAAQVHIETCPYCHHELLRLHSLLQNYASWPMDVLRPSPSLQKRLAIRIAEETGGDSELPAMQGWKEPEWEQVAPGTECKLLAVDTEQQRVSMLVRLAPGACYPAHTHAGIEELHLLSGELWIDKRKLSAGDYNRNAPGARDDRVWTETGCTCLLITSTRDILG